MSFSTFSKVYTANHRKFMEDFSSDIISSLKLSLLKILDSDKINDGVIPHILGDFSFLLFLSLFLFLFNYVAFRENGNCRI